MAQRKLAFQVFASQIPPSTYFPADIFVVNQSPLTVLAEFAQQEMSRSPVWMAHILNRLASFSISQPCLAACFQGTENIVFSCKNTNGNAEFSGGFQFWKAGIAASKALYLVQPSHTGNLVGVDHLLQPRPHPHPVPGHVRLKVEKRQLSEDVQQRRRRRICTAFRIAAVCRKKGGGGGSRVHVRGMQAICGAFSTRY